VALVIKHAMPMRGIILSLVSSLVLPYFSKLSHKRQHFRKKKKILNTKNVFVGFLYNVSPKHFSFSEDLSEI